jgi:hypothetical protein
MSEVCSTHGENINAFRILVSISEGKGLVRLPRRRCEDNI